MGTMTLKELKRQHRKAQRAEFKEIESQLHPCPTINGFDILHEHKGQYITFSAWKEGNEKGGDYYTRLGVHRQDVLHGEDFYSFQRENLEFLTT